MLLSLEYELLPGHSLGPFVLGSSLWKVLEYLREAKVSHPQVNVKYDPENPVASPIILHVLPYLDLLFSGIYQRLHTIAVRRLHPASLGMPVMLRYRDTILAAPNRPLRKSGVTRYFGPTYSGDVMKYPGIWFAFHEDGEDTSTGSKYNQGDDRASEVKRVVIHQKGIEGQRPDSLDELVECEAMFEELSKVIVKVGEGITLHFYPGTRDATFIPLGATAEDLNCELGPPLRVFFKEDHRMNIHATVAFKFNEDAEETDYFYNYFQFGIDFLISGSTHRVKKIILHTNVVGSPAFQRYMRCPWELRGTLEDGDEERCYSVQFFDKVDDLTRLLVPGSTDALPSMALDQVEDERLCLPSFKTRLLGFDGLVVETYTGQILTLTLF